MTVTFGLGYRKESPRIDVATEPYPGRWTHHVMVGSVDEIDEELLGWIQEAAEFSAAKKKDKEEDYGIWNQSFRMDTKAGALYCVR